MACHLELEEDLRRQGYHTVAGVDEAGRGPLAGPVMAAAVILPPGFFHARLNDSKRLSAAAREQICGELTSRADVHWSCARAEVAEIDRLNILVATRLAMERAVRSLPAPPDAVLVDGLPLRDFPFRQFPVVGGDAISFSIAAASVIAKVLRDRHMAEMSGLYPEYGFESHKGYGTKGHLERLARCGPCPLHRRSFGPVAQLSLDLGA